MPPHGGDLPSGPAGRQLCGAGNRTRYRRVDQGAVPCSGKGHQCGTGSAAFAGFGGNVGRLPQRHRSAGDILKLDVAALLDEYAAGLPVVVCANLPYYITSPILMGLLESRLPFRCITVLVQKEAAERLCATPGTRECGAVTLAVQYYAEAEILFSVSRGSFMPAPKVDSSVIRLPLHRVPPCEVKNEAVLFRLIRAAFGQRRKTLTNSLSSAGYGKATLHAALEAVGISPTARAEELTLAQFAALAAALDT